jgi:RNA polymerase primary sigma factor
MRGYSKIETDMLKQLQIVKHITNREDESLDRYLSEIGKVDLISVDMEVELARRIREGDMVALEKLTKANLRFVVSVAKQYQNKGLTLNDLINEGNVGLVKAAQRFDETRGFKFISYAVWWIRQCILQALAEQVRIVRLPVNRIAAFQRISKVVADLEQQFQREPSIEEVAGAANTTYSDVSGVILNSGKGVSFDSPTHAGEDGTLLDVVFDDQNPMPDHILIDESLHLEISRLLDALTPREAKIIRLHFGLAGQNAMNLEDIGESLGITRERVRQIKESGIRSLRKLSRTSGLNSYL